MRLSRAGARVALGQALAVVVAFCVAGYFASLSLNHIAQKAMRDHIRGEAASMHEEFVQKGAAHLPVTVAKRQRLWRGFDYRLESVDGRLLAGALPPAVLGWSNPVTHPPHQPARSFLALTQAMPNGDRLTVAQDLAVEAGQTAAITRTLALCGLLGMACCVALSYLASAGVWRRIAAISTTAHAVAGGDLQVRTPTGPRVRDDVDQLAATFNVMLDQVGVLIEQVRQVSTDIAHDLRTPLTRHRQRLERLRAAVDAEPALLAEVRALQTDVDEILRTFDALLQLSEIKADGEGGRVGAEDLAEVAVRVAEAYRPDIEVSGRRLEVDAASAPVAADEALLAQAVANLLENALRHTPDGATIRVRTGPVDDRGEIVVEDDGPGVPARERETVLRPFVRLAPNRGTLGSGLGLSIVAAVAARHGGDLSLEDARPGDVRPGLRVRIRLPLVRPASRLAAE